MSIQQDYTDLEITIASLYDFPVAVAVVTGTMPNEPLFPEEAISFGNPVSRRLTEIQAGRSAARKALCRLGYPHTAVPRNEDRSPAWPAGAIGSISHCEGFCGAVLALSSSARGIGFDAEPSEPLAAELRSLILTERESAMFKIAMPHLSQREKIIFSAKEAVFKCAFPLFKKFINFTEVALSPGNALAQNHGQFRVESGPYDCKYIRGKWIVAHGTIFTSAYL